MTSVRSTFRDSLDDLGVTCSETTPDGVAEAVRAATEPPAVGVSLPADLGALPDDVNQEPRTGDLDAATTGVTPAILGVADYGSVLLESDPAGTEPISLYPERHVAVLRADDVVADMPATFERLGPRIREGRRSVVFATGPSATADMGDLVLGAHGPKAVHVVLVHEDEAALDAATGGSDR